MHKNSLRTLFGLALRAIAAAIAVVAISGCNMPKPTPSGNQGTDPGGTYGTNQQPLGGGGKSGLPLENPVACRSEDMLFLEFDHKYHVTIASSDYTVTVGGISTLTKNEYGVWTSSAADRGFFKMEGKSGDNCTYIATSAFSAKISGICQDNLMILDIEEVVGTGGYLKGQLTCTKPSGEVRTASADYGYPPMKHHILIGLWSNKIEGLHGEYSTSWGTSGSKSWKVHGVMPLVVPNQP
jgi:hypothetical protein